MLLNVRLTPSASPPIPSAPCPPCSTAAPPHAQAAFSPSHLVPGIEPSADPVLQSRLFSYPDTHRHRLGVNYQQIPVNAPLVPVANFQRDGAMTVNGNQGSRPNYISSIQPLTYKAPNTVDAAHEKLAASQIESFLSKFDEDLDTRQPRALWEKVLDAGARERLVKNISGHLGGCQDKEIIKRQLAIFKVRRRGASHNHATSADLLYLFLAHRPSTRTSTPAFPRVWVSASKRIDGQGRDDRLRRRCRQIPLSSFTTLASL